MSEKKSTRKLRGYGEIEFACYFGGDLVEMERWTERGWMYYDPTDPSFLYFKPKFAHSAKKLI